MSEVISFILLLIGATFMFLGSLGLLRMPDLYTRMQASTKSITLGVASIMLSVAVHFGDDLGVATRSLAVVFFVFLTAPVGAQMLARAAHFARVPLWDLVVNELEGRYDPKTHVLRSQAEDEPKQENS